MYRPKGPADSSGGFTSTAAGRWRTRGGAYDLADDEAGVSRHAPPASVVTADDNLTGHLQSLVSGDRVRVLLRILGRQVPTTVGVGEVASA